MARVFAVTAAATNIRLNSQGRAESSFTVSNASGRPLRGRANVRATDPRCQSWLTVSGEAEREYKVGETHQVSVSVAVPPGSPPGSCSFQLTVVSAANPDEDFDEGPLITFDVVAAAAPAKGFPWWILIVAAVVLVAVGGVLWWVLMREKEPETEAVQPAPAAPAPAAPVREVKKLAMQLGPGWVDYRDLHLDDALPYDGTSVWRLGDLCIVQGMVQNSGNAGVVIGTLPEGCRPKERVIFNLNNHGGTARVDVLPTGAVHVITASGGQLWLSLTGIAIHVGAGAPLLLTPGWQNYKEAIPQDPYLPATLFKEGDRCVVSGLVRSSSPGGIRAQTQILVLPERCRPKERLIFNLNNDARIARVDVLPTGQVLWVDGSAQELWLSLSGIIFTTGTPKAEALDLRWTNYGQTYAGGVVHKDGKVCTAEGLVKTADPGGIRSRPQIATIGEGCRPANRLVFNLNNNEATARVDALADGRIFWQAGGSNHGWISLSGMVWVAEASP